MAHSSEPDPRPERGGAYDYRGPLIAMYAPEDDGQPDPGEVVWTWVPYEEDHNVGKDRPVVVLGMSGPEDEGDYVVLMVSSRRRDGDPSWVSIGSGNWDHERRDSYVRLDRVLAVANAAVRREGAALTREQYAFVLQQYQSHH